MTHATSNNSVQRAALRAAADGERLAGIFGPDASFYSRRGLFAKL